MNNPPHPTVGLLFNRRAFLRDVALWSAAATVAPPVFRIGGLAQAGEAATPTLAVAKGTDYEALVGKVLEPLGGLEPFFKKGARVVIKPNIAWDRTPEQAATTHPLLVKALVKLCLASGADKVMVFDRSCNDCRRTYVASGIQAAVQSLNDPRATCTYVDDRKFVPVKIQKGKLLTEWSFYKDALDADCYINMPIAKHHGLSTLTLGLKNIMGVIGGKRGQIHQSIAQKLADLNTVLRPKLNLVDATRILLRNGPTGGKLDDVKELHTLIASPDVVAADAYATTLFERAPDALQTTRTAAAMGLGQMDLNKVKMVKV
ncbi:MAG: DUF362 domain-containing protein [Verrucomicrobia bacterium]|nr:DUF362 domain-containing protein [Verrucomicrobiota bacterium]